MCVLESWVCAGLLTVRGRRLRGFPSVSSDTENGEDGTELGFGSQVRQQLQMEVHGGSSPLQRASPDVSPIACLRSGQLLFIG